MQAVLDNAALTFALAMLGGVLAQWIARHLMVPGIVVLLGAGVLLGPEVLGVIRPGLLGPALPAIVVSAVAVILFEGGLNLELRVLRRQRKPIRRLVTIGALVTLAGGSLAARYVMDWDWGMAAVFGTLVMVTGPTVVTPLLRRIKVKVHIATILVAEGVFVDAIGATVAAVTLQIAVAPSGTALGVGVLSIVWRLAVGVVIGLAGGGLLALLLSRRHAVPRGFANILALAVAIALSQLGNAMVSDSGVTAAVIAGMVVGNVQSQRVVEIAEFKEQLTTLLVGTLFMLLAANVGLDEVWALGTPGLWTVAILMIVVRPISIFLSMVGSGLATGEKLFLAWMAPRGIVAAAIGSLFAVELAREGIGGGKQIEALVFLVIAVTVTVQGLSGGLVASLLEVRQAKDVGYLLLGANPMALYLAGRLRGDDDPIALIDADVDACRGAEDAGFQVFYGNGLDPRVLTRARAEQRAGCIGLTSKESVNMLFASRVAEEFRGPQVYVAIDLDTIGVSAEMVRAIEGHILFGGTRSLKRWIARWRQGLVTVERFRYAQERESGQDPLAAAPRSDLIPMLLVREGEVTLFDDTTRLGVGDEVEFAIDTGRQQQLEAWLSDAGWIPAPPAIAERRSPGSTHVGPTAGSPRRATSDHDGDDRQDQEGEERDLREPRHTGSQPAKAEHCGDQSEDEQHDGCSEHDDG